MPNNPCNYNPMDEMSLRNINRIFQDIHFHICNLQAQLDLTPVVVKSGTFRINSGDVICIVEPVTLWYVEDYTAGTIMFYEEELLTPVTGFDFIVGVDNIVRFLDPVTGTVGDPSGQIC